MLGPKKSCLKKKIWDPKHFEPEKNSGLKKFSDPKTMLGQKKNQGRKKFQA